MLVAGELTMLKAECSEQPYCRGIGNSPIIDGMIASSDKHDPTSTFKEDTERTADGPKLVPSCIYLDNTEARRAIENILAEAQADKVAALQQLQRALAQATNFLPPLVTDSTSTTK